jgi:peptide deformylase
MTFSANLLAELAAQLLAAEDLPPIVQAGHPALRAQAERFDGQLDDGQLAGLIALMRKVMHAAPGVGLAAPQLGLPLQLAVLEDHSELPADAAEQRRREPLDFVAVLNPVYTALGEETAGFYEGCLSVRGWQAVVERPLRVRLDYQDPTGAARSREFEGWSARIVQHETDHLAGTLYIDRALTRSLASNAEYARRWAQPGIGQARRGLGF